MNDGMKFKQVSVEKIKSIDEGNGGFVGYASVFNVKDSYGEATVPGCFAEYQEAFLRDGWLAVGHDWQKMGCGFFATASEDSYGYKVTVMYHGDAESQAIRQKVNERIAAGKTVSLSIGYFLRGWERKDDGVLMLTKIELKEVSIVNVPANTAAIVAHAKSGSLSINDEGEFVKSTIETWGARVIERVNYRESQHTRAGSELSGANVATIDAVIEAYEGLAPNIEKLREIADRNRKGSETEPSSKSSEFEESTASLRKAFYINKAKQQQLLAGVS